MRIHSRAELETFLIDAEEAAIDRAEIELRDDGKSDDEIAVWLAAERTEWERTRRQILETYDRARIDAEAAQHELQ